MVPDVQTGALTVGDVWESNPLVHRKSIQEVLSTAQGEQALEQFLRDLREFWVACEITMTSRDNVKIVIGWDVLFTALEDNLNSLVSLKQSPYFRNVHEFQEDTASWESRLTHLRGIFEVWVEVQRKWLYLRGIFKNADIKAQLPAQFTKFKSIDSEYLNITKRVATKPAVLDLLQLDNLQRQLERQDTTMALIQKALGDYLEKQRQIFPRFYFINNDDLVEIIGNSNEPSKIVVHLNNMFAAISGVEMTDATKTAPGSALAVSLASKEGEVVPLISPVDVTAGVKDWLASLESQMAITLASLLQEAISASPFENSKLLQWVNKFPAQVVILTSQLVWSQNCEKALSVEGASKVHEAQSNNLQHLESKLHSLSECVLQDMEPALRKKCEQLLTEMVHQRDVLRQLIAAKPDYHHAYNALGYSLADRKVRLPEAKQLIEKAVSLAPGDAYIQDSLGWVEFRLGNASRALSILQAAYAKRPDAEIAAHLGEVLWSQGQRDQALKIWREGLLLSSDNETLQGTLKRLQVKP